MGTTKRWPTIEEMQDNIEKYGSEYTGNFWKKITNKTITSGGAELYNIIQKAHLRLTGFSLPATVKGAIKTAAQVRNSEPQVDELEVTKKVNRGFKNMLRRMRDGSK